MLTLLLHYSIIFLWGTKGEWCFLRWAYPFLLLRLILLPFPIFFPPGSLRRKLTTERMEYKQHIANPVEAYRPSCDSSYCRRYHFWALTSGRFILQWECCQDR